MKKPIIARVGALTFLLSSPGLVLAQSTADQTAGLHHLLENLYQEMLPLCHDLIGVGRGLAGLGALCYIGSRVWRHIAQAEPVELYPLLRPFGIGLALLFFPSVLDVLNGALKPTVTATAAMVEHSDAAIAYLLLKKEEAIRQSPAWQLYVGELGSGDREKWYEYTHPDGAEEGMLDGLGNDLRFAMAKASYNFRNAVKGWLSEVLQVLFQAAGLCINTLRTFQLVVLSILGPLVLGLSVFDGFGHTWTVWLARYIQVYLWLPVAHLFGGILGKIQEGMLRLDIGQIEGVGDTYFSPTDSAYLIFLMMGLVGYLTVPSVAGYVVQAGGGQALLHKATHLFTTTTGAALSSTGVFGSVASGVAREITTASGAPGTAGSPPSPANAYQHDKLAGK